MTTFANQEDFEFYDKECTAHIEIKKSLVPLVEGPPMMLYFEPGF